MKTSTIARVDPISSPPNQSSKVDGREPLNNSDSSFQGDTGYRERYHTIILLPLNTHRSDKVCNRILTAPELMLEAKLLYFCRIFMRYHRIFRRWPTSLFIAQSQITSFLLDLCINKLAVSSMDLWDYAQIKVHL